GADAVCACAGVYFEDLTVTEGISLRGGYDCNTWTRDPITNVTAVTGLPPDGVKVPPGVTAATSLEGIRVAGGAGPSSAVSSALTVTDASPTLEDLVVTDRVVGTPQMPQILYGLHVRQTGSSPASPTGIVGGSATTMSVGMWASGDVTGLSAGDMTFFWGGSVSGPGTSYGTLLDGCTGTSTWSVASLGFFHDTVASNSVGFSASGVSCRPIVTASYLVGCELAGYCAALQCTGAPCTVTDS